MDDATREREYKLWKKAVTRTFDWVESEERGARAGLSGVGATNPKAAALTRRDRAAG